MSGSFQLECGPVSPLGLSEGGGAAGPPRSLLPDGERVWAPDLGASALTN